MMSRRMNVLAVLAATSAATIAGCGMGTAREVVRSRAADEFQCAPDQVVVKEIGGTSFSAIACGTKAVYTCVAPKICQLEYAHPVGTRPQEIDRQAEPHGAGE